VIALVNAAAAGACTGTAALHASPDLLAGHDDAPELADRRVLAGAGLLMSGLRRGHRVAAGICSPVTW
jgi:hypothetical protein